MGRSQISLSSWQGKSVLKSLCTLQGSGWLIGQSHLLISRSALLPLTPLGPSGTSHASSPRGGPPHTSRHCCRGWAAANVLTQWYPYHRYFLLKWLNWHAPCYWCRRSVAVHSLSWFSVIHAGTKHFSPNKTTPLLTWEREDDYTVFSVAMWLKWRVFCVAKIPVWNANMLLLLTSHWRLHLFNWKGRCKKLCLKQAL